MDGTRYPASLHSASDSTHSAVSELVSVIIPAYNVAGYIAQTLDSVFAQTYRNFEVIIVNDGSPDTALLEQSLLPYRDRITYVVQQNQGPSAARNNGIRRASGTFLAMLDGDDLWLPEYLQVQTKFLNDHPQYGLVYSNAEFFGDPRYAGKLYTELCPSAGEATADAIIARRCHVFTSVTLRKEALHSLLYDESLRFCEDFEYWVRLSAGGCRIGYHSTVLVRYRKHATSLSANSVAMMENSIAAHQKLQALWPPDHEQNQRLAFAISQKSAELALFRGKLALSQGNMILAAEHFRSANLHYRSRKLSTIIGLLTLTPGFAKAAFQFRAALLPKYRINSSNSQVVGDHTT